MATAIQNHESAIDVSPGFAIPDPHDIDGLQGKVSDTEWQLRCDLAATYRLCAMHCLTK